MLSWKKMTAIAELVKQLEQELLSKFCNIICIFRLAWSSMGLWARPSSRNFAEWSWLIKMLHWRLWSIREAAWKKENQTMQDQIDLARPGQAYDHGRAIQTELENELNKCMLVLRDEEKYIHKFNSHIKNEYFETEMVERDWRTR